jgi:hypothetical protein
MRTIHFRNKLIFLFVMAVCVSLFGVSAVAKAQDSSQKSGDDAVAEAARKARDKKKEAAKPKKVFTNEDLGELKPNSVSTVGQDFGAAATPAKGAEGDQNQGDKAKDQGNAAGAADAGKDQEQVWRQRFRDAYGKLAQLEKELDILQREDNKAQLQYYPDPQKAMNEGYTRKDINDKQAKITAKKQEIDQQKARISDMQDDLRKAGGDPGWGSPQ